MRFQDQPAHFVAIGIDERIVDDFAQADIRQGPFGGHPLSLRLGRDSGQRVARLFLVGLGEQFTQVREGKSLAADGAVKGHGLALNRSILSGRFGT